MEDMQKMIERYKRELLEYSRVGAPAEKVPEPKADTERKKPQVIGYISEDAHKELEEMNVPEEIIESIRPQTPDTAVPITEDEETITYEPSGNDEAMPEENEEAMPEENEEAPEDNPEETFSEPRFTEIPSFQQTREQITEESVPEENVPTKNASGVTDNSSTEPIPEFGSNETVSEEQAERLTEQPISGTDIDEQLTGRSFEDGRMPQNDPADVMQQNGSQAEPGNFTEPIFNSVDEFEENNLGSGTILFRVYTAREAIPIENAVCRVTKDFGGTVHTFHTLITDESGRTPAEPLPAPSTELSQDSQNKIQPFSLYDALITREGYADVELREIPVFDGVSSIQQVAMIPIPNADGRREAAPNAR